MLSHDTAAATFAITDTRLYVLVATLSAQHNAELLEQLRSDFKRTITWNKCQPKGSSERQNKCLDFLIDPSFQGANRLFVLSFENENDRTVQTKYYLPTVEIKDYNAMICGKKYFDREVKSSVRTYDNIKKIATNHRDNKEIIKLLVVYRL